MSAISVPPPPIYIPPGVNIRKVKDCSICLESLLGKDNRSLRCTHVFHRACIQPWEERGGECPNCRAVIASPSPSPLPPPTESLKPAASPNRSSMLRHLPEPLLYSPVPAVSIALLPPPPPRLPAPLPHTIASPTTERLNLREFAIARPRRTRAIAMGFRPLTQYAYDETVTPPTETKTDRNHRLRIRRAIDQERIISMLESRKAEASAARREKIRKFTKTAAKGAKAFAGFFSRKNRK